MGDFVVPPVEAVEYGRRALEAEVAKLKRFQQEAYDRGDKDAAARWRTASHVIRRNLLGYEDGGCVIVAFDKRWLDPGFRRIMTGVREQIAAERSPDDPSVCEGATPPGTRGEG